MKRISPGILAALMLVGCGGGGGETAPVAPSLNWSPQPVKSFAFVWGDVAGETEYRLLENPDGIAGYTQVATIAANSSSFTLSNVSLPERINARYILQACNSAGCTDSAPVMVSGNLVAAIGYFKVSNLNWYDAFGETLALSSDGNTLAVASIHEASSATGVNGNQLDNSAERSGAVYVFTRSGSTWSQQAYLKASNSQSFDSFGDAISLSADGNTLAVGASHESSNATGVNGNQADNSAGISGAVYVFTRSGSTWSQQAYVKASNTDSGDRFGWSLTLSGDGNTLAVGAPSEGSIATGVGGDQADNSGFWPGAVYVFARSGGTWSQQAYLKGMVPWFRLDFGYSTSLSGDGDTLAVGAPGESSNATGVNGNPTGDLSRSGAVFVFTRSGSTWSQQAFVKASNTGSGDAFGNSVAISNDGNTLGVAAYREDSNAIGTGGNQNDNSALDSGAVYLFTRSGSTWSQQAYLKASNSEADRYFGFVIALSGDGNTLAVGTPTEDSNAEGIGGNQTNYAAADSGAVYRFTRSGNSWSQQAYVKASNTRIGDFFGYSVGLSGNGGTLAVGAPNEDVVSIWVSGGQGVSFGFDLGAVYLY